MIKYRKSTLRNVFFVILMVLVLAQTRCCPPYCPVPIMPDNWDEFLDAGDYGSIQDETAAVIKEGPEAEYYADALLYRGLAELRLGNIDEAMRYLEEAEAYSDKFYSENYALGRLYQGKMILSVYLDDLDTAVEYRDLGIEYAPELRDQIMKDAMEYGIGE